MTDSVSKKFKVCVVTGTRAEYGLLRPLIFKIKSHNLMQLKLVVTGSHLSDKFGNTVNELIEDGLEDFDSIPIPMEDDSRPGMAACVGDATEKMARYFEANMPDLVVLLGDRYEILAVAIAAHFMRIPIAHISGGDITEGAIDDAIRHCITKLAVIHFPGCDQSAKRIIQMGEQPDRVFNVGELGVENCLKTNLMSREELAKDLGFDDILNNYGLVTFHPVTMEDDTAEEQLYNLIEAMDEIEQLSYVITLANADSGGRAVNDIWINEAKKHSNWYVVSSLGVVRYLTAMKYAKAVIGNSSSGLLEAPVMGTPTVNIGDRQKGRMMAKSVVCCRTEKADIVKAIKKVDEEVFVAGMKDMELPFGDGSTSEKMIKKIQCFLENNKCGNKKTFYDI